MKDRGAEFTLKQTTHREKLISDWSASFSHQSLPAGTVLRVRKRDTNCVLHSIFSPACLCNTTQFSMPYRYRFYSGGKKNRPSSLPLTELRHQLNSTTGGRSAKDIKLRSVPLRE